MPTKNRTVVIGIDGVPFGLLNNLSEKGVMPNFAELKGEGVFTPMKSSIPEISSVSWSSVITGKNPGEHGIYGFTGLIEGTYTISFPNFRNLKAPAFWHEMTNKSYVILNVPSTYPARELNGVHISGFVSPDLERAVYPPSYLDTLRDMNYRVDVDSGYAHKSMRLFLNDLFKTNEIRVKAHKYFWNKFDWDVFMLVFTGSDRLEHFLWHAYEDENHEYHDKFLQYFREVDFAIGEIVSRINEEDQLIMLSDHGMEAIKRNVNVNSYLAEEGFLVLVDKPKPSERYKNIRDGTKAFALDPARIYLNRGGKYPNGSVKPNEEEDIIASLISAFEDLKYNGEEVIKKVYRKEEIYHGEQLEHAPDLVLLSNPGFNLKGNISAANVFEEPDIIIGKHTYEDAFLYVRHDKGIVPEQPTVEDVRKIIETVEKS